MGCCCVNTVTTVAATDTAMTLSFAVAPTVVNECKLRVKLNCNTINANARYLPVFIDVNFNGAVTAVPLIESRFGNQVYSNELRNGALYCCHFGAIPSGHVIINCRKVCNASI